MGYGDKLMSIGSAWALHEKDPKRRRVAVGADGVVDADHLDLMVGCEDFMADQAAVDAGEDVIWFRDGRSKRPYIDYDAMWQMVDDYGMRRPEKQTGLVRKLNRYLYNYNFRPTPAPIRLTPEEEAIAQEWSAKRPFVILEPFIKAGAPVGKQWPIERFRTVGKKLLREVMVYQIGSPDRPALDGLPQLRPDSFRQALAYLKAASLYIGPEGGLHHGSAAMGTPAVVVYGGFTPPVITTYPTQISVTGDDDRFYCGTRHGLCPHCEKALDSITVESVLHHARKKLGLA